MTVTLGQQYNIGEKPTVILYTYINRHAGTPEKQRRHCCYSSSISSVVLVVVFYLLPNSVFVPCDHGLDFHISLRKNSINQ